MYEWAIKIATIHTKPACAGFRNKGDIVPGFGIRCSNSLNRGISLNATSVAPSTKIAIFNESSIDQQFQLPNHQKNN
jgi:hypothetical protein